MPESYVIEMPHNCYLNFMAAQATLWAGYTVRMSNDPQAIYSWTCSCDKQYSAEVKEFDDDNPEERTDTDNPR